VVRQPIEEGRASVNEREYALATASESVRVALYAVGNLTFVDEDRAMNEQVVDIRKRLIYLRDSIHQRMPELKEGNT
jgi:hypothetical protein